MSLTSALAQFDTKARESLFANVRTFYSSNLNACASALQAAICKGDVTLDNEHAIYTSLCSVEEDLAAIFAHSNLLYASIITGENVPIPAISQAISLLLANARLQPTFSQMTWRSTTILKSLAIMRIIVAVPHWAKHLNERYKVSSNPEMITSANEGLLVLSTAAHQFLNDTSKYPPPPLLMNLLTREQQSGDPSELLSACKSMAEIIVKANGEIEILSEATKEEAAAADRTAFRADPIALAEIEASAKERLKALEEKNKPAATRDVFRKPENIMQVLDMPPKRPSMDAAARGHRSEPNEMIEEEFEEDILGLTLDPLNPRSDPNEMIEEELEEDILCLDGRQAFERVDQRIQRQPQKKGGGHEGGLPDHSPRSPLSPPAAVPVNQRRSLMPNPYGESELDVRRGELDVRRGPGGRVDRSFDLSSGSLEGNRAPGGAIKGARASSGVLRSQERWPHMMGGGRRATHSPSHPPPPPSPQLQHTSGHLVYEDPNQLKRRMTHDVATINRAAPPPAPPPSPPQPVIRVATTHKTSTHRSSSKKKEAEAFIDTPLPPGIRPRLLTWDLKLTGAALILMARREKEREDKRLAEEEAALLATKNGWKRAGGKAQVIPPCVPLAVMEVRLQESVKQQLNLVPHNSQQQPGGLLVPNAPSSQQQQQLGGLLVPNAPNVNSQPKPPSPPVAGLVGGGKLVPQSQGGRLIPSSQPGISSLASQSTAQQSPPPPPSPPQIGLQSFGTMPSSSSNVIPVHTTYQAPSFESLPLKSSQSMPPAQAQVPLYHSQPTQSQPQSAQMAMQPQPQSVQMAMQPQPQSAQKPMQSQPPSAQMAMQPQPQSVQQSAPHAPIHAAAANPLIPAPPPPVSTPMQNAYLPMSKPAQGKSRMGQLQSQASINNTDDVYKAVAQQLKTDAKVVPSTTASSSPPLTSNSVPMAVAGVSAGAYPHSSAGPAPVGAAQGVSMTASSSKATPAAAGPSATAPHIMTHSAAPLSATAPNLFGSLPVTASAPPSATAPNLSGSLPVTASAPPSATAPNLSGPLPVTASVPLNPKLPAAPMAAPTTLPPPAIPPVLPPCSIAPPPSSVSAPLNHAPKPPAAAAPAPSTPPPPPLAPPSQSPPRPPPNVPAAFPTSPPLTNPVLAPLTAVHAATPMTAPMPIPPALFTAAPTTASATTAHAHTSGPHPADTVGPQPSPR